MSAALYPTALRPRGTSIESRKRAIASYRCAPISASGIDAMDGSVGVVWWKIASASRWRDGEDGAVNWKTAGALSATLWGKCERVWVVRASAGLRDAVRNDGVVDVVAGVFPFGSSLVQSRDLRGG